MSFAETQGLNFPLEFHANHLGHGERERTAGKRQCDVKPPCADGQHAERSGCRGVAVGAQKRFARYAETLQMDLMAYPIADPRKTNAVFGRDILQIPMVIGILKPDRERLVVCITDGQLRLYARDVHRFELKINHCPPESGVNV